MVHPKTPSTPTKQFKSKSLFNTSPILPLTPTKGVTKRKVALTPTKTNYQNQVGPDRFITSPKGPLFRADLVFGTNFHALSISSPKHENLLFNDNFKLLLKKQPESVLPSVNLKNKTLNFVNIVESIYKYETDHMDVRKDHRMLLALGRKIYSLDLESENENNDELVYTFEDINEDIEILSCSDSDLIALSLTDNQVGILDITKEILRIKIDERYGKVKSLSWKGELLSVGCEKGFILNYDSKFPKWSS